MSASLRFYGLSLPLACGLVGILLSYPRCLEALGSAADSNWTVDLKANPRAFAADQRCVLVAGRSEAKAQVIAQLLKGKLTLLQAAAHFRDLNAEPAHYPDRGHLLFPGDSQEEKLCRQVIAWAQMPESGQVSASDVALLTAQLEAELAAELRQHGRIELPRH